MLEIEMKFAVADFGPIEDQLRSWGAHPNEAIDEADQYFNAPDRDFRQTDEAFRLRRIGDLNRLTYKGPKQPGLAKTRPEIEIPLGDGPVVAQDFFRMAVLLGYRPALEVRKRRRAFAFQRNGFDLEACLDDVEEVGRYVELEILAPQEKKDEAEHVLVALAKALGLGEQERRSYLAMLTANRGASV